MSDTNTKRAPLAEIREKRRKGELFHDPNALEGESLGPAFWAKAMVSGPKRPRSVHLKLDPDVFEFFYAQSNGKGHLTRMQSVLRAYVNAHRRS